MEWHQNTDAVNHIHGYGPVSYTHLSKDPLGNYICVGVFAIVFFQSAVNIGMVLCVAPVIGITLPFFSSGGSSMLTMFMTIGLVLSVYHKNHRTCLLYTSRRESWAGAHTGPGGCKAMLRPARRPPGQRQGSIRPDR